MTPSEMLRASAREVQQADIALLDAEERVEEAKAWRAEVVRDASVAQAVPCPNCGAVLREWCGFRQPTQTGRICPSRRVAHADEKRGSQAGDGA